MCAFRFGYNKPRYCSSSDDGVTVPVIFKNVDKLHARLFEINTHAYYELNPDGTLDTSISLDGYKPSQVNGSACHLWTESAPSWSSVD